MEPHVGGRAALRVRAGRAVSDARSQRPSLRARGLPRGRSARDQGKATNHGRIPTTWRGGPPARHVNGDEREGRYPLLLLTSARPPLRKSVPTEPIATPPPPTSLSGKVPPPAAPTASSLYNSATLAPTHRLLTPIHRRLSPAHPVHHGSHSSRTIRLRGHPRLRPRRHGLR